MRVAAVERPATVRAVLDRLDELGGRARLIAGGTALVPELRAGLGAGAGADRLVLVSLDAVTDLVEQNSERAVGRSGDPATVLAATTRLAQLEQDRALTERFPALAHCLASLATPRIRQMATVGGALAQRDAGYDLPVVLAALDAVVRLRSSAGERSVRIEELFAEPGVDGGMRPDEVLTCVHIPHRRDERSGFVKLSPRTGTDRAVICAAASLRLTPDGRCEQARIVLGGLGSRLLRATDAEARLRGAARGEVADAVRDIAAGTQPPSDVRASSRYRREMAPVIARRALHAAWPER